MCGIGGVLDRSARLDIASTLEAMITSLRTRGPDDEGMWADRSVGLVHTRLSIVDTSPRGRQPLGNEDNTVLVVANGEIYNHRELRHELIAAGHQFRSGSDSEVLVHLYEETGGDVSSMLRRLQGMFAFGLWDVRRSRLLLARDRLGIKPLVYADDHRRLVFASTVRAVTDSGAVDRAIDATSLAECLALLSIPGPHTIYRSVRHLEPGTALVADTSGSRVIRWWVPTVPSARIDDPRDAADELEGPLDRAIRRHLQADVEVAAFLSGGIDSGLVTALAARQLGPRRLRTFAATFPGDIEDESDDARAAAERVLTVHTEMEAHDGLLGPLDAVVASLDQPQATSSALSLLRLSEAVRPTAKVVLTGDGGDELFGGYTRHDPWTLPVRAPRRLAEPWQRVAEDHRSLARIALRPVKAVLPRSPRLAALSEGLERSAADRYLGRISVLDVARATELLAPDLRAEVEVTRHRDALQRLFDTTDAPDEFTRRLLVGLRSGLPDEMLCKLDRSTMAVALEARVPLLDDDVVTTALSFAPRALRVDGVGKLPLRLLAERYLGRSHAALPKRGFNSPLHRLLIADCAPATTTSPSRSTATAPDDLATAWERVRSCDLLDPALRAAPHRAVALTYGPDVVYGSLVMAGWRAANTAD